jgi:hypothetical protein
VTQELRDSRKHRNWCRVGGTWARIFKGRVKRDTLGVVSFEIPVTAQEGPQTVPK